MPGMRAAAFLDDFRYYATKRSLHLSNRCRKKHERSKEVTTFVLYSAGNRTYSTERTLKEEECMDALLVKRAQRKDVDAFVALMEKHKTGLYKVAKSYLRSEEDVADVMQDTVLSAYEHIQELRNVSYFKTWLTRILINHCKNLLRQQKHCVVSEQVADSESSKAVPESDREFYALIGELPEDYRMIFLLYYGEGFHTGEIAQILELNENTVKSRLKRGREKLRQVLCY